MVGHTITHDMVEHTITQALENRSDQWKLPKIYKKQNNNNGVYQIVECCYNLDLNFIIQIDEYTVLQHLCYDPI